jgi:hypothetical protein
MKLKLLEPHIVGDAWRPRGYILDPAPPGYQATPLMEGLDAEGIAAVDYAKLVVWGRYWWPYGYYPPTGEPLDNPPIPRPIEENQPVNVYSGSKEYIS